MRRERDIGRRDFLVGFLALLGLALATVFFGIADAWWIGIPLGVTALVLGLVAPTAGVCMLVLGELVFVGASGEITTGKVAVFALLAVVLIGTIARVARRTDLQQHKTWIRPLALFLGYCLFSIVPAFVFKVGVTSWLRELFPLLNYGLVLTGFSLVGSKRTYGQLMWFLSGLMFLVLVRDFLFVQQSASRAPILPGVYNALAAVFPTEGSPLYSVLAILAFLQLVTSKDRRRGAWLLAPPALLGAYVLVLSGTRTYWLGGLLCILLWILVSRGGLPALIPRLAWIAIASAVVGQIVLQTGPRGPYYVVGGWTLDERVSTLGLSSIRSDRSLLGRYYETAAALQNLSESPVVGLGLGYELTSRARFWEEPQITRGYVHNSYVYVALKLGIVGLILFGWLLFALLWKLRGIQRMSSSVLSVHVPVLLSSVFFIAFASLTTSKLNDAPTTLMLSLLLGGAFGISNLPLEPNDAQA